jgi:hypothetical protein
MSYRSRLVLLAALLAVTGSPGSAQAPANPYVRDAKQPVDAAYTKKIKEYTTETFFNSPLTDYLPASKTVPTPESVLGDVAGAPGKLPYSREVYQYMRMVEKASPRVKVYSIGKTEEGREMIAVAVSSETNLAQLEANRARLAKLAAWWINRYRSTTSPARFTRPRRARQPPSWSWSTALRSTRAPTSRRSAAGSSR